LNPLVYWLLASALGAIVYVSLRELVAGRTCRDRGHLWERRVNPFSRLITAHCRRCGRWFDGS
jgi:hypothetical protein